MGQPLPTARLIAGGFLRKTGVRLNNPGHTEPVDKRQKLINAALERAKEGDPEGTSLLFQTVYDELNRMARRQRLRWDGNDTLDTTALVHETYVKLSESGTQWESVRHFYAVAARAMRQLLINYAEKQRAKKRGGDLRRVEFDDSYAGKPLEIETLLSLISALDELATVDERRARVFEFRFLLGLSVAEVAELLEVSHATVKRDWTLATAWMRLHWSK